MMAKLLNSFSYLRAEVINVTNSIVPVMTGSVRRIFSQW